MAWADADVKKLCRIADFLEPNFWSYLHHKNVKDVTSKKLEWQLWM